MSKEIYISSTPHETRLAIVENDALTEIYYERENEYTLAGSIYNGRVTRVLPGMQSSFVDIGLERDAFLYITDFMEEAPDSAEFDTSSTGDHAPRAPRVIDGESAVRTDGGRSSERSDRGDRGGRGRRGGRDRDRGGDRGSDRPAGSEFRQPAGDRGRSEAPRSLSETPDATIQPPEFTEGGDIGEGAPGADGSRRWRGRRGRRRGRTTPGDPAQLNGAPASAEGDSDFDGEILFEGGSTFEIDGSAAQPPAPPVERSEAAPRSDNQRDDSQRGGRRDRGRRDGQRQDGQRTEAPRRDSEQRPDRPQRVPRGFTPSRDLYGVDSGAGSSSTGPVENAYAEADPTAEPIILPGESLSKYRKGGDEPQAAAPTGDAMPITLAPPANLYTIAAGWDGGATLPGETLSRRSSSSSRPESRDNSPREPRRDSQRDGQRDSRPGRDGRSDRGDRGPRAETRRDGRSDYRNNPPAAIVPAIAAQSLSEFEAPATTEASHSQSEATHTPQAEQFTPALHHEAAVPVINTTSVPPPPRPDAEYEPSEASASYRVDPLPRTEYRQSAPVLEPEAEAPVSTEPPAVETHDITSIAPTGEMYSEPVAPIPAAVEHPAPAEEPEPTSPIHHEAALVLPHHDLADAALGIGSFAPGFGDLAEETIDEDEPAGTTIHASAIEEMDYSEEETLEGAADLGTMLREMSIDQITRTSPEIGDEDDLEEDELDEDDLEEEDQDDDGSDEQDNLDDDLDGAEGSGEEDEDHHEQAARTGDAADQEFFAEQFGQGREGNSSEPRQEQASGAPAPRRDSNRDADRRTGGRRDGRRDGRRGRNDRERSGDRPRSTGGSGDRERSGHGGGRRSMQSTNLPAISDLLKPGQEILVQIAKEPIAKKGARITSHIALPGRFLVFMPTVNHTGVSRKIESDGERRRLKEILLSEKGEAAGGFIVRTAASGASEEELRSDLRFLLNLWSDIKARSESSKSPALIYHDLNLIERILRDQVTDNFSAIWVDTDTEYERVLRFLQRFQPSLIRRVKLYSKETPLFEQFGITEEINKALRSKVWLKSGGSIVINQTEALVAIDINTGKFVGKTARLEDTIVKTNLDAIPEIVRQIRLRDLGGIIIIDFIDMDERKNRNRVMAALEDELKSDRAPSKVLQFNDFGLVAITRKRVKQSLERTLSTTCNVCVGTGMVKSPVTVCNDIYVEMKKMHKHLDRGDVMLRVHPEVVKQLKTSGSKWLTEMEEMAGKTILVKSDPSLHPEQFDIH
jgi:ribonuclease E